METLQIALGSSSFRLISDADLSERPIILVAMRTFVVLMLALFCMGTTHGQILVAEEFDPIPVGLRSEGRYSELVDYLNVKRDMLEKEGQTESLTYALMLLDLSGVKALTGDCDSERDIELALNYIEGLDVEWLSYWIATLSLCLPVRRVWVK